eukprot:snap_masked-scaffold_20-processed-gene-5.78-mRNA-1 protein AED:0.22 eAED:0.22 QI:0/-1/0/1/-1/1/1/0/400
MGNKLTTGSLSGRSRKSSVSTSQNTSQQAETSDLNSLGLDLNTTPDSIHPQGASNPSSQSQNGTPQAQDSNESLSVYQSLKQAYSEVVHAIIRPPRANYTADMLGQKEFMMNGILYFREDSTVINKRAQNLVCSHWRPNSNNIGVDPNNPPPCIIYLHGNSSCRLEALEVLPTVLGLGMTLFCFDFSGCGSSEGEYISLGWYERDDVDAVVRHLREKNKASSIGLWGRSMGAATAIMYAPQNPEIACFIADSPFYSLPALCKELVESAKLPIPKFAVNFALSFIRKSVKSKAKFDINKLEPIDFVSQGYVPALFAAAEGDEFIKQHHAQKLHDNYAGDKNIITFDGDHNSPRGSFLFTSVTIFLANAMIEPLNAVQKAVPQTEEIKQEETQVNPPEPGIS